MFQGLLVNPDNLKGKYALRAIVIALFELRIPLL